MADPEPRETAGLERGGSVRPGDTPPAEASTTAELGQPERVELRRAWGPVPLAVIVVFSFLMAALFAVAAVVLVTR